MSGISLAGVVRGFFSSTTKSFRSNTFRCNGPCQTRVTPLLMYFNGVSQSKVLTNSFLNNRNLKKLTLS